PLVAVHVGAHGDVLAAPLRRGEFLAHQVRRVDLDHDLGVEVVAGVQVKVGMRVPGEAVVAHYAVGDEVAGPGGDVEHRQMQPERVDRYHVQPCVALDRDVVDRATHGCTWNRSTRSGCICRCSTSPP